MDRDRLQGLGPDQVQEFLLARASLAHIRGERFSDTAFADDGQETGVGGRDFAFEDQRRLNLCAGGCRETKGLAA